MTAVSRLRRLSAAERRLLVRALVGVVTFRLALSLLPWRHLIAFTKRPRRPLSSRLSAERIEWAVRWASRSVPGATCFTQALALHDLLVREGHRCVLHIGVNNDGGRFAAHAWVELDGVPLLGKEGIESGYSRLLSWPPPA